LDLTGVSVANSPRQLSTRAWSVRLLWRDIS